MTLTKPRIMSLLLLTGGAGMFVGAGGVPPLGRLGAMLLGLALACGGASALNHVLDRDIDRLMGKRTERRPVAAGRVPPSRALEFGLALSAGSFVLLASTVHLLTAVLALVGNLFYVLVYTGWLKRSTPQNIVIGGAAGAAPPVLGWAAVTGTVDPHALLLFLIVFVWTPPHFWALAIHRRDDYAEADVPMLPVTHGVEFTGLQILRAPRPPEGRTKREGIANDPGIDQASPDGRRARPRLDLDESLRLCKALVRLVNSLPNERRTGGGPRRQHDEHDDRWDDEFPHYTSGSAADTGSRGRASR